MRKAWRLPSPPSFTVHVSGIAIYLQTPSAGHAGIYRYLANRCYYWGHYPRFVRYFKDATIANPVLLLDAMTYRTLLKSVFDIILGLIGISPAERARESSERTGEQVNLRRRKRNQIFNFIFNHIESKRWSAALNDES